MLIFNHDITVVMQIRWLGHSCFEFTDGKITVVTDPHDGKSIGIRTPRAAADIVLMSHDHYDHNAAWVIEGNHKDYLFKNGKFESKGIVFHGYSTFHDKEGGKLRGLNTIYKFEMDGMTVVHCGDLGDMPSEQVMRNIKGADFLFIPTGGYYTMEKEDLKRFVEEADAKVIVPMHYRVGGLSIPIANVDSFLDMIPEESVDYLGNSLDITKDELPENKECWVFDFKN